MLHLGRSDAPKVHKGLCFEAASPLAPAVTPCTLEPGTPSESGKPLGISAPVVRLEVTDHASVTAAVKSIEIDGRQVIAELHQVTRKP